MKAFAVVRIASGPFQGQVCDILYLTGRTTTHQVMGQYSQHICLYIAGISSNSLTLGVWMIGN